MEKIIDVKFPAVRPMSSTQKMIVFNQCNAVLLKGESNISRGKIALTSIRIRMC